jgi:ribokinase
MADVVVVGSLTMDLNAFCERMPKAGETLLGEEFSMVPGGKGNNQAIASARQGARTAMVGRVGRDSFGDRVMDQLAADGVDFAQVARDPELATGIAHIRVDRGGQNSIVMVPLANGAMDEAAVLDSEELIAASGLLLTQLEIPLGTTRAALEVARRRGVVTVLNPAPAAPLDSEVLALVDYLVPNEFEAELLTGQEASSPEGALKAARILLGRGCRAVVVTMGGQGSLYADRERVLKISALKVDAVDTVAAGDAFCGGLAAALAGGANLEAALARATAAGALATTVAGATSSLPTLEATMELLEGCGGPSFEPG